MECRIQCFEVAAWSYAIVCGVVSAVLTESGDRRASKPHRTHALRNNSYSYLAKIIVALPDGMALEKPGGSLIRAACEYDCGWREDMAKPQGDFVPDLLPRVTGRQLAVYVFQLHMGEFSCECKM